MPAIGIEPIREYKSRRILSPVRLPVPPRRHIWDLQDLNLWPSACKADALPAELRSHVINEIHYTISFEMCQDFFCFFKNVTHDILLLHILTILPDDCQIENQPHHWTNNVYLFNTFISFLSTHPMWDVTDTEVKTLCTLTISTHTSRVGCDDYQRGAGCRWVKFLLTHPVWDVTRFYHHQQHFW